MRPQIVKILTPILLFLAVGASAQAKEPPPPQRTGTPPIDLSIDSGLILLVMAGLAIGGYYYLRKRQQSIKQG